jgi:predicted nucleic acid-binding protein
MVFNTSVVSELFHVSILEKLKDYSNSVGHSIEYVLPDIVFNELKKDRIIGKSEELLKQIFRILKTPEETLNELSVIRPSLGPGELSVLATVSSLTQQNTQSSIITIIDDKKGRKAAEELGLERHGTLWIILQLKANNIISKEKAVEIVMKLPYRGFHISEKEIEKVIKKIKVIVNYVISEFL